MSNLSICDHRGTNLISYLIIYLGSWNELNKDSYVIKINLTKY